MQRLGQLFKVSLSFAGGIARLSGRSREESQMRPHRLSIGVPMYASFSLLVVAALMCHSCASEPWTLLRGSEAEVLRQPCSRPFPGGLTSAWLPASSDVLAAEAKLAGALGAALGRLKDKQSMPLTAYRRQYAGFVRNGQPVLYVNGIADWPDDWRRRAVRPCDGGPKSFGAVFDVRGGAFDSFVFNGEFTGPMEGGGW